MTTPISEKELPSVKFENEIKGLINYSTFESYKKNETIEGEIDNWVQHFHLKLGTYSTDSSHNLSLNNDERCKQFNYLINTIISKVNSLSNDPLKRLQWSTKIKESRDKFFLSNNNILNCNENNKYIDEDYKILGTFCEDSNFIQKNLGEIQDSVHCQKIVEYMSSIKDRLISVHELQRKRTGIIPKIDDTCSTKFLHIIFPSITCISSVKRQSQVEAPDLSDQLDDSDKSDEELKMLPLPASGDLTTDIEGLVTTSAESEPIDGQSSNTLNTVGLPIFGVLGCSFLLYKFTPVGSIFRSRIQNKGIIPINNDDYSIKQILSNTPNNNDIYSENTQYNISYQTL
ncbi:VIR protein [Plasmodium vivax]|uniref:VIR protein n=1 Tax=Plasmodium vivax TaxID=5855 RepID=A0A1G4E2I0_PLAVI|nr:VIR protein [Plasmodium vivax]